MALLESLIGSSTTTLDVLFCNRSESVVNSQVRNCYCLLHWSPHDILGILQLRPMSYHQPIVMTRNTRSFDTTKFIQDLDTQPWKLLETFCDVNTMWHYWKSLFLTVLERHAPLRWVRQRKNSLPWITSSILQDIQLRNQLHKCAIQDRDPHIWQIFQDEAKFSQSSHSRCKN